MIDPELLKDLEAENCYSDFREVPGHGICAIEQMNPVYWALHMGLTKDGREGGYYSFETYEEAEKALRQWSGIGDPGQDWLKFKCSHKQEYSNPEKFPWIIETFRLSLIKQPGVTFDNIKKWCLEPLNPLGHEYIYHWEEGADCNFLGLSTCLKHGYAVLKTLVIADLLYTGNKEQP